MTVLRLGISTEMSRNPKPQPWISFFLAWTQLGIDNNDGMNKIRC